MTERQQGDADSAAITELIAIGRDREAVDLATRGPDLHQRGRPMDGVQQLDEIMPLLHEVVDGISPDQLGNATPCAHFTVESVLEHMIGGAALFAPAFRGEAPPTAPSGATTGPTLERWRHAMVDLLDAVRSPGAQERTIASPFGEVPGALFARYVAFDGIVHGWDLAVATGQPYDPPSDLVAEVDEFIHQLLGPEMRDGDTFAAEVEAPADASPIERLVAFSGRQPTTNTEATK